MERPQTDPADHDDVLTVADINEQISETIEHTTALQDVRCLGEISEINEFDWGVFIDLVYEEYELSALMWASRYETLEAALEPGMEVICEGAIEYYVEDGQINLKPWNISVVGAGDRALSRKRLRAELGKRGWFSDEHKQPLPRFPARIGIVTSVHGDARYDIEESIHDRYPEVELLIGDARVQGVNAPVSIANSIHTLDRQYDLDVIIIGRGGGSETDLEAFDSEPVAEAVFTAETPIVAAVGHREDEPIVYDVADTTAITPTAAGETVVKDRREFEAELDTLAYRLDRAYELVVDEQIESLDRRLETAYDQATTQQIAALEQRIEATYESCEQRLQQQRLRRRYGAIIVVLLLLIIGLGVYIIGVL
ncbi:exodeoxyribonuclease VII large subunit [Halorubrum luteum]